MSDNSSSDDEFIPVGFNPEEFRQKRLQKLKSHGSVLAPKKQTNTQSNIPIELQYESLLNSASEKLPEKKTGHSKMKLPLEVRREVNKTSINVIEIAEMLNREPEHIMKYLMSELSTTGSFNKEGKLLLKGIFLKSQIQDILRMYIEYFIVCGSCDNVEDTVIEKENRLYFLKCKKCGGKKYVGNIMEGYKTKGEAKPKVRGFL
ncbi:Translation initiation factor IF-2b [Spraguea lophii 42_110]|uniref:Translation initiation factor IF-2b n=1 Tax=Spraguea lophii (strain 42_110) TaxID=1358809 RepID=S7W685_SPRLO|nr:Translation initiation factor IF-2b [Spraguea lophii 42_110]